MSSELPRSPVANAGNMAKSTELLRKSDQSPLHFTVELSLVRHSERKNLGSHARRSYGVAEDDG
jgi:hypothetical protein